MAEEERPRILYTDAGPEPPFPLRMEGTVISGFGRGSKELGIPTANLPVDESTTPWIATAKSGVYFGYASLALPPSHPDHKSHYHRHRTNPRAAAEAPAAPPSSSNPPHMTITSVSTASETFPSFSSSSDGVTKEQTREESKKEAQSATSQEDGTQQWQIYPMVMSIGYNPFYKNKVRSAEVHVLHNFAADFYGAPMRLLILGFIREERDYSSLDALVKDINIDCDVARQSLARPAWTPREGTVDGARGELDGSWLVRDS